MKEINRMYYDFVRNNNIHAVRRILYLGADPNYKNALQLAICNGSTRMALTILKRGGDPNLLSKNGETSLILYLRRLWCLRKCNHISININYELLEQLVSKTDLKHIDKYGNTALVYAMRITGIVPRLSKRLSVICEAINKQQEETNIHKTLKNKSLMGSLKFLSSTPSLLVALGLPVVASATGLF